MLEELRAGLDALADRRAALLAELGAASPAQRTFRPAPDAWSLLEVAHHLALVETVTVASLERRPGRARRRSLRHKLLHPLVKLVLRTGIRVKAPSRRVLPEGDVTLSEVEGLWREAAAGLERALAGIEPGQRREEAMRHPIGGPLTCGETVDFLRSHFDHHLIQVRRIRAAAGFPSDRGEDAGVVAGTGARGGGG